MKTSFDIKKKKTKLTNMSKAHFVVDLVTKYQLWRNFTENLACKQILNLGEGHVRAGQLVKCEIGIGQIRKGMLATMTGEMFLFT